MQSSFVQCRPGSYETPFGVVGGQTQFRHPPQAPNSTNPQSLTHSLTSHYDIPPARRMNCRKNNAQATAISSLHQDFYGHQTSRRRDHQLPTTTHAASKNGQPSFGSYAKCCSSTSHTIGLCNRVGAAQQSQWTVIKWKTISSNTRLRSAADY